MWNVTVDEIEVPGCKVEFSNEGLLTLHIQADFQELDKLKGLPSSSDNTFLISAETGDVSLFCKACWLISFDLRGHGSPIATGGTQPTARLTFKFKS